MLLNLVDIHRLIQQGLQKDGVFAYKKKYEEEIDIHLNAEYYKLISDICKGYDKPQDGYAKDLDSIDALRYITKKLEEISITTSALYPTGSKEGIMTSELFKTLKIHAQIKYNCNGTDKLELVKCDIVPEGEVIERNQTSLLKSTIERPLAYVKANFNPSNLTTQTFSYGVITDGSFSIEKIFVDYIVTPKKIKYAKDNGGNYDSVNSVQCFIADNAIYKLIDNTITRIKNIDEHPQDVIQRMDIKNNQN